MRNNVGMISTIYDPFTIPMLSDTVPGILHSAQEGEGTGLEGVGSVEEVWEVKVVDVVAGDDVRVREANKPGPALQDTAT